MSKILAAIVVANLAIVAVYIGSSAYYGARHTAWLADMKADHAAFVAWEARVR